MKPKDLLKDLEKGDRTMEMLTKNDSQPFNPFDLMNSYMRNIGMQQMQVQASQQRNILQRLTQGL